MSQSCCRGVLRTSPVKAIRASMQKAQKHAIPVRVGLPRAGNGTVSSGTSWSSGPWRSEPKATHTNPKASPNLPDKSLSGNAWAEWRHTVNLADSPAAELLSEHCFAENALRVMWLTRGSSGSAAGEPELLQRRPAHQPGEGHQGFHAEGAKACDPSALGLAQGWEGTVSSGTSWSSDTWRSEPKATHTDPKASPNLPEKKPFRERLGR